MQGHIYIVLENADSVLIFLAFHDTSAAAEHNKSTLDLLISTRFVHIEVL